MLIKTRGLLPQTPPPLLPPFRSFPSVSSNGIQLNRITPLCQTVNETGQYVESPMATALLGPLPTLVLQVSAQTILAIEARGHICFHCEDPCGTFAS